MNPGGRIVATKTKDQPKLSAASEKLFEQMSSMDRAEFEPVLRKRLLKLEQDLKAAKASK